ARSINFCRQMKLPIVGIVENMSGFVCPHCHTTTDIFRTGGGSSLAKRYEVPFLGSLPLDPTIGISGDAGMPYIQRFAGSVIAATYRKIAQTLHETRSTEV
ncbi:MAG: P-loop NTPase, partial [Sphaerochaetaceae bacterium]|nr:P-loop NTPase [Sphaerochaetaceae bacterium]